MATTVTIDGKPIEAKDVTIAITTGTAPEPPDPPPTRKCYFGYFGDNPTIVDETKDHADLTWVYGWPDGTTDMVVAKAGKAAGNKLMLGVYGQGTTQNTIDFFTKCQQNNILDAVAALYPFDEPDVAGLSDVEFTAMVRKTRVAAAKFPPIANAPIACIYGNTGNLPGYNVVDWVCRDNYGAGPQILPLQPHQKLMIIAGGMNSWRESPDAYVNYALAHPEVVAVLGFMWVRPGMPESQGIKGNGMAPAYRAAGKTLTGRP